MRGTGVILYGEDDIEKEKSMFIFIRDIDRRKMPSTLFAVAAAAAAGQFVPSHRSSSTRNTAVACCVASFSISLAELP